MPAGYAHFDFGNQVIKILPNNLKTIITNQIEYFHIGVHGPDILFYHDALKKNKIASLGFHMHTLEAYDFFYDSKLILENSQNKEASLAYLLGFITHFTLDSECHGYIRELEETLSLTHSELESELDRQLLINNGLNPLTTSLTTHIHPSVDKAEIIAPFFKLQPQEIERSLKDLLFYLKMLLAPNRIKRFLILLAMKIAGIYDKHKGLMINYEKNIKSEEAIQQLIMMKEKAIPIAKDLMLNYIDFLEGKQLHERYRKNYE